MQDSFNQKADAFFDPNARVVTIPAHTYLDVDYSSVHDDARRGQLKNATNEDIRRDYGTPREAPAQAYAFTTWKAARSDLPEETREALKKALEEDDQRTPAPLKGRIVLSHTLKFKGAG